MVPQAMNGRSSMDFIETTRYQKTSASGAAGYMPLPQPWRRYEHPNGDIYYYNPLLRLITPDDIRDPTTLQFVLDARADHLQCLEEDNSITKLANDWELTLTDVTDTAAVIGMYSRRLGIAYNWTEEKGLEIRNSSEYFWSHVAEYPSHHEELPPNAELAFAQALTNAKAAVTQGEVFPFSEVQINQIMNRYRHLKGLQARGENVVPALAWLMGAVMPLDACGKAYSDGDLEVLMDRMQF